MLSNQDQLKEISCKFDIKGLNRVRLSNVSSEVIPGGQWTSVKLWRQTGALCSESIMI